MATAAGNDGRAPPAPRVPAPAGMSVPRSACSGRRLVPRGVHGGRRRPGRILRSDSRGWCWGSGLVRTVGSPPGSCHWPWWCPLPRWMSERMCASMPKTIVITGASSGGGLAAAEQFAARGDQVVVVGRNPDRLDAGVERVRRAGSGREPGRFRADFERLADVHALAAHLLDTCPTIDVLANNAGGMVAGYRRTEDGFEATIQGN